MTINKSLKDKNTASHKAKCVESCYCEIVYTAIWNTEKATKKRGGIDIPYKIRLEL